VTLPRPPLLFPGTRRTPETTAEDDRRVTRRALTRAQRKAELKAADALRRADRQPDGYARIRNALDVVDPTGEAAVRRIAPELFTPEAESAAL
jgi:hypothetical protein